MKLSTGLAVLVLLPALAACAETGADIVGRTMTNEERAAAYASVDPARDCYNKPWFDTVSASDHRTVIKGMTPVERDVCGRITRPQPP